MHEFIRAFFKGLIPLFVLLLELRGAEGMNRSSFTFKTPLPVVYTIQPYINSLSEMQWVPARERDRPRVNVEFGSLIILKVNKNLS